MGNSNYLMAALLSVVAAGTGCEMIAGIEDRYPPTALPDAATSSGATTSSSSGAGGTGGGSACGPTGTTIPVPDSVTQFCSHLSMTGFCPDATMSYYGQDGNTQVNVPIYQLSQDATEKTLTDCMTGLVWQVEPVTASDLTWDDAVSLCTILNYAGFDDWRLPSRRELISLLDLGRPPLMGTTTASVFPAELDSLVKPAPANPVYWTSSPDVSASAANAWAVRLISSGIESLPKSTTPEGRALCVRGDERYRSPVLEPTAAVVTDISTGLIWEATAAAADRWSDALLYCNNLDLGGWQDWRLPTMKELAYLIDDGQTTPAIDPTAFPGAPAQEFWSSSPSSTEPTQSWTVSFDHGLVQMRTISSAYSIRCVRTE